jgi:hypothetical protein
MWWTLDPLMFPTLFGGVVIAFVGLISSYVLSVRAAGCFCIAASISTGIGVVIAQGISERPALGSLAVSLSLQAIPALAGVVVLRRAWRGADSRRGAAVDGRGV